MDAAPLSETASHGLLGCVSLFGKASIFSLVIVARAARFTYYVVPTHSWESFSNLWVRMKKPLGLEEASQPMELFNLVDFLYTDMSSNKSQNSLWWGLLLG